MQAGAKSERPSFEELATRTAPIIALVGCPNVHASIIKRMYADRNRACYCNLLGVCTSYLLHIAPSVLLQNAR